MEYGVPQPVGTMVRELEVQLIPANQRLVAA